MALYLKKRPRMCGGLTGKEESNLSGLNQNYGVKRKGLKTAIEELKQKMLAKVRK